VFADRFSARWTRTVNFSAATYRFTVNNIDDGVRLYVGGLLRLDRWFDGSGTHTVDVNLSGGNHGIILEFYENGGLARANVSWTPLPPNPSSNLVAIAASVSQINLSWADNSSFEDGFKIERWNGGSYVLINTVGPNVTSYADSGLSHSTTYSYRVRAYNSGGDSGYTNESSATTLPPPPSPPSNLAASGVSSSEINLSWTDNSNLEQGFNIERWNGGSYVQVGAVGANVTTYTDSGLFPSTTYSYRVRAFTSGGNSGYSNVSSASTSCSAPVGHDCQ
jgi:hypothetical protein